MSDNVSAQVGDIFSDARLGKKDVGNLSNRDSFIRADKIDLKSWYTHLSRVWSKDNISSLKKEEWEIELSKLDIRNVIAHGTYGTVYRGVYDGQDVAGSLLSLLLLFYFIDYLLAICIHT
ncbi:hypothetical protein QQ045_001385 [Rhodiola kirilowii]